jgi:hypothetical protein
MVGHRIMGNRQQGRSAGVGYYRVHVAIDDVTRLAYVEVLADEQQATAIGFLSRAVAWFNGQGVECRQCVGQRSGLCLKLLCQGVQGLGPQAHPHQALHAPHQRQSRALWPTADFVYIQPLCREWAYGMPFKNSEERNPWLPCYLSIYNRLRKHTALGGRSPQQRLNELLC